MYTVVNGADQPGVPFDTITSTGTVGDPSPPRADFDIWDQGGLLSFDIGQEVIIWDENAPAINGGGTLSPPSQNYLLNPTWGFGATNWTDASGGHITYPATNAVLTFSNLAVASYYIFQTTLKGYAHPGVQYMLSAYVTESALVNGNAFLAIQFQDAGGNALGSTTFSTFTPTTSVVRHNVSATAPANTMFIVAQYGGNATNSTNSGTITFTVAQLEPMWFASSNYPVPVSYPTPDLNANQVSCYLLPDNTCSRYARLFAGFIDDWQTEWDGKLRIWHISCAGSSALLDSGMINGTFTAQYDDQIIGSVITTYFNGVISNGQANIVQPLPVVRSVLVDSQNYTDNSFREVMNGLVDLSGDMYYLDQYYRLFKNPPFYNAAPFGFSSSPDNVTTFSYYDYLLEKDGTQRKRKIKVIGGKSGSTVQVSQVLDQDASNPPLTPAYAIPPYDAKVNDTNLISTVTTTTRGLAEVSKFGSPKMIITCKSQKYVPQGFIIYFTATLDNIINQPYVVQQVQGSMVGATDGNKTIAMNEFAYTLGYYNPTLLDHIKNANKALNRASVLTGVNNVLAYDLSVREPIVYSETITTTPGTSKSAGVYGTATYGGNSYS